MTPCDLLRARLLEHEANHMEVTNIYYNEANSIRRLPTHGEHTHGGVFVSNTLTCGCAHGGVSELEIAHC